MEKYLNFNMRPINFKMTSMVKKKKYRIKEYCLLIKNEIENKNEGINYFQWTSYQLQIKINNRNEKINHIVWIINFKA